MIYGTTHETEIGNKKKTGLYHIVNDERCSDHKTLLEAIDTGDIDRARATHNQHAHEQVVEHVDVDRVGDLNGAFY